MILSLLADRWHWPRESLLSLTATELAFWADGIEGAKKVRAKAERDG